jgi:hypothetical protein
MRVSQARRIARDWVLDEGSRLPGFAGAYVAGSITWMSDDAELAPTSDLDLNLVFDATAEALPARHKLVRQGVLLELTHLPLDLVRTPEQVLGHAALAGGLRVPSVLLDPTGHLTALQAAVARSFADPVWVRRRCEDAQTRFLAYLDGLSQPRPSHEQVIGWVFGTSGTTLLPLIAALRNPTVRRRYVAARELLAERGQLDLYEELLGLLGCRTMRRAQAEHHLDALAEVFDAATAVIKTPFPFATDLSALARPIAIDGSRELVARGLHREAVFWLVVTHARCQAVFAADAPALLEQFAPGYRALLTDLGIETLADMQQRAEQVRTLLPRIWAVVEELIATP